MFVEPAATFASINGMRSLPKYMSSPSRNIVGEPKPPRSISSSVLARSRSLYGCEAILAKNASASMPQAVTMGRNTSSCEMSCKSPQ